MKVELLQEMGLRSSEMISFAGRTCYEGNKPHVGHLLDIEKLFDAGHHTTLQHSYYTFYVEGISVSDVTFGLHLASPFYNTSQRSGRYCAGMFAKPDFGKIGGYIRGYWPTVSDGDVKQILEFISYGISVYQENIEKATAVAERFIAEERPFASKFIKRNAAKYAQEQMRVFRSTIFPTALTCTMSLSAIVALYHSAWSPAMRDVTRKMARAILEKDPSIAYMFYNGNLGSTADEMDIVGFPWERSNLGCILDRPRIRLHSIGNPAVFIHPDPKDLHPMDMLPFKPRYMDNNTEEIKADIEVSVATMGQDQKHRTIKRSQPRFTGNFYLPPIPEELGMHEEARMVLDEWMRICSSSGIPASLSIVIAPYGAMVSYRKIISYNAAIHEASKRLCWRAQEETYHLNLSLREAVIKWVEEDSDLLNIFPPFCVRTGKCGEGKWYCGRDRKESSFQKRQV